MAFSLETIRNSILTSLRGRRLGLDKDEYLVGHKGARHAVEDIQSTVATTTLAYGITRVLTSGSSQGPTQHNLPAPVVGVEKLICMQTTSTGSQQFLSTPNGASIICASDGTTKSLLNFVGPGGSVRLVGLTTAVWAVVGGMNVGSTNVVANVTLTTST